jgi:hypothetical protein
MMLNKKSRGDTFGLESSADGHISKYGLFVGRTALATASP